MRLTGGHSSQITHLLPFVLYLEEENWLWRQAWHGTEIRKFSTTLAPSSRTLGGWPAPHPHPSSRSLSPELTWATLGGRSHGHYARAAFCLLTLGDVPPPSLCFILHLRYICSHWLLTGFQSMFIARVSYLF